MASVSRRVSRPVFWGLGLERFWSRSRALCLETLHRLVFMKFCKEFLKKRFQKMIVQFEQLFNLNALTIRGDQVVRDRKKVGNP